jgi:hypothetical protein
MSVAVEVDMRTNGFLLSIGALVLVGGIGYGGAYSFYTPQVRDLENKTTQLISEVSALTGAVAGQQEQILSLRSANESLAAELRRTQSENERYEERAADLQTQADGLQGQLSASESQSTALKSQLASVLDITVNQNYQWTYARQSFQWEFPIPLALYDGYRARPRPISLAGYVDLARDPGDDEYIDQIVQRIDDTAARNGYSDAQKLNFTIAFVQSLPYTADSETSPSDEYPRFPVETLFDRGGDCEDTSILVAALLDRMGYDVALLVLPEKAHMAVGVALTGNNGSYYTYDGRDYYYLETTGRGWRVGQVPPDLAGARAIVYPLRG